MQIAINKLVLSKQNVRQVKPTGIEALAENIHTIGLIHPLTVTQGEGDTFEVVAGRRRWEAMKLLVKSKRWPEDFAVSCEAVAADKVLDVSLSENAMREDMHPADQFEAFKALADKGQGVETIAATFGVTPMIVERRLKLAAVDPKLMKLYRNDEMTLEHLMAFTLTDDRKLQRKVWDDLPSWAKRNGNGASQIKAALTEGMVTADRDERIRFVGMKALEEAGAVTGHDLFAGDEGGVLIDSAKLAELVAAKMETLIAKEVKAGWAWAENATGMDWQTQRGFGQITPTLSDEQQREIETRNERLGEIEQAGDSATGEEEDALIQEQEKLEAEIQQIEHEATFTAEDKARSGVLISIDHNGKVSYSRGRLTPEQVKAERKAAKGEAVTDDEPKSGGHSAALIETLTAHRTKAIAACLAENPHVALAETVKALILSTTPGHYRSSVAKISGKMPYLNGTGEEIEQSIAGKAFAKRQKAVVKGVPEESAELLPWLIRQSDKKLLDILAVCVASTVDAIERKNGEKPDAAAVKQLSEALSLDMADYWEPTAEGYFGRVSKSMTEAVVKEVAGADGLVTISGCKKPEMNKRAEAAVAGKRWLPELLR